MQVLLSRFPGLAGLPHVDLGVRPTPVEERRIAGLPVLVKRDDRTSGLYGGNKVRALEFLLAGAPRRVLTFSSLSAYHAYATAVHARRLGIACDAVIVRKGPRSRAMEALPGVADRTSGLYGGNKVRALEFLLAGAPRRVLTFSSLSAYHAYATAVHARRLGISCDAVIVRKGPRSRAMEALPGVADRVEEVAGVPGAAAAALRLWRPGTRVIRPGGLSLAGTLGYVEAALELDRVPRRIYVPLGTGTTTAGLLAGLMLRDALTELVAVRIADPFVSFRPLLWIRAFGAIALLRRFDPTVPRVSPGGVTLRIVRGGGRYGEATRAAVAAVAAAGDLELEPTYTGKTLAALLAERAEGALFVNTYCPLHTVPGTNLRQADV